MCARARLLLDLFRLEVFVEFCRFGHFAAFCRVLLCSVGTLLPAPVSCACRALKCVLKKTFVVFSFFCVGICIFAAKIGFCFLWI